jgi:16S rRNA (cytidine1402-2'-O)-methyltransferase
MTGRRSSKESRFSAAVDPQTAVPEDASGAGLPQALSRQIEKLAASGLLPGLYLVSTPIGNLADITVRALFTLASADVALCEDTRHSRKLMSAYGIRRKLEAYHDFSGEKDRARVLAALAEGKSVALISDAGTPLIADPGFKLVREALASGFNVFAVPGPSALLAALVTSGLPTDRFYFGGFLPPKEGARRDELEALGAVPGALIFYESGSRLAETLEAIQEIFPERQIAIARELTKLYETVLRGDARELIETIRRDSPPGEFVILVGPAAKKPAEPGEIEQALRNAMQTLSLKEAVEEVAKGLGVGRKAVYNLALQLRDSQR